MVQEHAPLSISFSPWNIQFHHRHHHFCLLLLLLFRHSVLVVVVAAVVVLYSFELDWFHLFSGKMDGAETICGTNWINNFSNYDNCNANNNAKRTFVYLYIDGINGNNYLDWLTFKKTKKKQRKIKIHINDVFAKH